MLLVATLVAGTAWAGPGGPGMVGTMQTYRTTAADTLEDIAMRFDLGYVELVAANPGLDPMAPGIGVEVTLPTAHLPPDAPQEGIVINLSEMRLYYFGRDGEEVHSFPIGIGREGRHTPLGRTRVVDKKANPTWRPPASIRAEQPDLPPVVPPGPENPLGEYAFYLGWPAYLIHGTNKPAGVGRRVSAGCIRMYPQDVERLFSMVEVGTPVTVVDQPIKFGWHEGELYVEAHLPKEKANDLVFDGSFQREIPSGLIAELIPIAGEAFQRIDFDALHRAVLERRGYPVRITR